MSVKLNLSPFSYFDENFDNESPMNSRGLLLQGLKCTTIKTNSANYCEGVGFDVIASPVYTGENPDVYVGGKGLYYQYARVRCRVDENERLIDALGSMYGNEILFHSKKMAGVCKTICFTGEEYIDIIVALLTDMSVGSALRLEEENIRFTLINNSKSLDTIEDITVSDVAETSEEATYGNSRIVYNRDVKYTITFAERKDRIEKYKGSYTNSNFAYINLFDPVASGDEPILLNSVNDNLVSDEDGTLLVKDFKTARTFFILAPDKKSMTFRGNAYYLNLQVPLI